MSKSMPQDAPSRPRLNQQPFGRNLFSTVLFIIAMYTILQLAIPRSIVQSISMEPNLIADQRLVISRVSYLLQPPQRGDIVVFISPQANAPADLPLIKRLIGLPGETVEFRDASVYINGVALYEPYINEACNPGRCQESRWQLKSDEYFFMGDNRNHSHDSRAFGLVKRENIIGRALIRYWPPADWGILDYSYDTPGQLSE